MVQTVQKTVFPMAQTVQLTIEIPQLQYFWTRWSMSLLAQFIDKVPRYGGMAAGRGFSAALTPFFALLRFSGVERQFFEPVEGLPIGTRQG